MSLLKILQACLLSFSICTFISLSSDAHPNKDLEDIRMVIQTFSRSISEKDVKLAESILADNLSGLDRKSFLTSIKYSKFDRISQRNATSLANEDGSVTVEPIEYYAGGDTVLLKSSITLKKEQGTWKIDRIGLSQLPKKSKKVFQPDLQTITKTKFSIKDKETGNPAYSRVHIRDHKGEYWPVHGHQKNIRLGWREDVGGDVHIGNKTYAYVKPEFIVYLPEGKYTIEVFHGMEYLPEGLIFMVDEKNNETFSIALRRWVNMKKDGWYSGYTHVHFLSDQSALLESQGEDLNVINILATKWGELITNVDSFTGEQSHYSNKQNIVYVNEESRHGFLGHTILHPLKQLIYPLSWGGPREGVPGGFDYPPMANQADKAHAQGAIVTVAHFPFPTGEVAVDIGLGKIDSIDLFTWGDAFTKNGFYPGPVEMWYKFLNTGATLPATAGTDKMLNVQVVGSVRTYVHLNDGDLSYNNWIAGIKKGETFVTTGPMIWLTADSKPIGAKLKRKKGDEILLKARVKSATPVKKLELIKGGQIIAKKENPDNLLDLTLEIKTRVIDSSWFAARAYSPEILEYQKWDFLGLAGQGVPLMAHTSPIYVTADEKPITSKDDAIYLMTLCDRAIQWVESTARFQKPIQKQEMMELFRKAKARYSLQVK
jgi:hypothetical protein